MNIKNNIETALNDPSRLAVEVNRLYHRRLNSIDHNPRGTNVLEEEWDNLIILDACRFDAFERYAPDLPGETEARTSLGSTTREFIRANFRGKKLYDTVYVSANGWYQILREDLESDIFRFLYCDRDALDGLTSTPKTVTDTAVSTLEEHPNKRFIVHYMQPHQPYIGQSAKRISHEGALLPTVKKNNISRGELRTLYDENLRLVLEEVEHLLETLEGKTVITADHGEYLGERQRPIPVREYGHPLGIYTDELVTVPWHTFTNGSREIMSAGESYDESKDEDSSVESHLKALGYKL
jgi:hypothetical protein